MDFILPDPTKCPQKPLEAPTGRCLTDPGFRYIPSYQTNLRARFQLHGWTGPEELGKFPDPYEGLNNE